VSDPVSPWAVLYPYNPPAGHWVYDLVALLFVAAFFDFRCVKRLRNLDVVMLCAWVPLGYYELGNLKWTMLLGYLPLLYFVPRLLYQVWRTDGDPCVINFSSRWLIALAALFYAAGCAMCLAYPEPFYSDNLSDTAESGMAAARVLLGGGIPYGWLPHGWDSYPPAYYYIYVPFEWAFTDHRPVTNHAHPLATYGLSARVLACSANLACLAALAWLGARLRDRRFGYALAFAWAVLPYTLMSVADSQTGHLVPAALTVIALLGYSFSPWIGAALLALLAAAAFYPALFAAPWAARLGWRTGIAFALLAGLIGLALWLPMLQQDDGLTKFAKAVSKHEDRVTRKSPWYQHPWMTPLKTCFAALYLPFVAWTAWAAWRRRGFVPCLALTGAIVVWGQLFYRSAPGRYHPWMMACLLPLLLLGGPRSALDGGDDAARPAAG